MSEERDWRGATFSNVRLTTGPAVLLRDTPEDRERLIAGMPNDELRYFTKAEIADAIIAALREPRRYPEPGEER